MLAEFIKYEAMDASIPSWLSAPAPKTSFEEVGRRHLNRERSVVYSPFKEDKTTCSQVKMSAFDSNPFADPVSDNPFNVSVYF